MPKNLKATKVEFPPATAQIEEADADDEATCIDVGLWTAIPESCLTPSTPDQFVLKLKKVVNEKAYTRIKQAGAMSLHLTGCAGDFENHQPQYQVAQAMATQVAGPGSAGLLKGQAVAASFLYHLGDIVYKPDSEAAATGGVGDTSVEPAISSQDAPAQKPAAPSEPKSYAQMYNNQFFAAYSDYNAPIFAIAGNHDGKTVQSKANYIQHPQPDDKYPMYHFLLNFCAATPQPSSDNATNQRPSLNQPYPYWRLDTPQAYIIGLYSNVTNGGMLDDPAKPDVKTQYQWLVSQLREVQARNAKRVKAGKSGKAILLTLHYPPYSGAANFKQRGDPTLSPTSGAAQAQPLANVLAQAYQESGQRPDAVFSAHAHLYQRLTYQDQHGEQIPYIINGSGGHGPIEKMAKPCHSTTDAIATPSTPFDARPFLPSSVQLPFDHKLTVAAYNDQSFGFMRLTLGKNRLVGEFFTVDSNDSKAKPTLFDAFVLNTKTHRLEV